MCHKMQIPRSELQNANASLGMTFLNAVLLLQGGLKTFDVRRVVDDPSPDRGTLQRTLSGRDGPANGSI